MAVILALGLGVAVTTAPGSAGATADGVEGNGTADWVAVDAGFHHTCGIRRSGRLYCWGSDRYGALGNGGENVDRQAPVQVAGGHTDWSTVSAGENLTCGTRQGRLYCWGRDHRGQLGDGGRYLASDRPREVAGRHTNWTRVSAGADHVCGRRADRLYCWGDDSRGQLGNGGPRARSDVPVQVAGAHADWGWVSAGNFHTCGRRGERIYCWGAGTWGQLGDGAPGGERLAPHRVTLPSTRWIFLGAGGAHTCAGRSVGGLYCWGSDVFGALGNGPPLVDAASPQLVTGAITNWRRVEGGEGGTCAQRTSGQLHCWGSDQHGALGDGSPLTDQSAPVEVAPPGAHLWDDVTHGGEHVCARTRDDRLWCWGWDAFGQLGDGGASLDAAAPSQVAP